ncbi:MAG TPA: PP2C family serine/threonine-protein phosphatase [Pseudonocardia sp.]|jgi:serine/threonine protein phosphatase PrpC
MDVSRPGTATRPADDEHVEIDLGRLAGVSDRGLVHTHNEDAMALGCRPAADLRPGLVAELALVACDGVSTVRQPELASRAAADTALRVLLGPEPEVDPRRARLPRGHRGIRAAAVAAAESVAELGRVGELDPPSCTLVCAHLEEPADDGEPVITVGWVGDSRAYWLAAPGAEEPTRLLTTDHSWATAMIESGRLDAATALADRRAHAITRWLGRAGEPEPEVVSWAPGGPGALLLCTDGLWNYLPDAADLAAVVVPALERGESPLVVAKGLTDLALRAGGHDNITVLLVPVPGAQSR